MSAFWQVSSVRSSTFSIQNALTPISIGSATSWHGNAFLFSDACRQGDGSQNGTASCQNATTMFNDLETLHNCVVYPAILQHHTNADLDAGAEHLIERLHIKAHNSDSNLSQVMVNNMEQCLLDTCANCRIVWKIYGRKILGAFSMCCEIPTTPILHSTSAIMQHQL